MPGMRQGPEPRPAWMHPQDLVNLLESLLPDVGSAPAYGQAYDKFLADIRARQAVIDIAWMHDLIEDGIKESNARVTKLDLSEQGFSIDVVDDIVSLSHKPGEEKVVYLATLVDVSPRAKLVKLVDRICNLREGKDSFKDKRWARYVSETNRYVLPLLESVAVPLQATLEAMLNEAIEARPVV